MIRNCYPSFVSRSSLLFLSLFSSSIDRVDARSQRTQPTRAILLWEDLNILTLVCALLFDIHFLFLFFLLFLGSSFLPIRRNLWTGENVKCTIVCIQIYIGLIMYDIPFHYFPSFSSFLSLFLSSFLCIFFATPATNYTARRPICLSDERRESSPSFDCISVALIKKTKRWPDYRSVLYRISLSLSLFHLPPPCPPNCRSSPS